MVSEPARGAEAPGACLTPRSPARRPGVLVVEADWEARMQLDQQLSASGFDVTAAPSRAVAVDAYLRDGAPIDVVVAGAESAELPATALLAWLKSHFPGLPCCFLAGPEEAVAAAALRAAGGLVLTRPLSYLRLAAVLRRLVADSASDEEQE
jgi:DNA-binding response OmpR family regulator